MSIDAAREAIRSRTQFNVIHPTSGMKVGFFVAGDPRLRKLAVDQQLGDLLDRVLEAVAEG